MKTVVMERTFDYQPHPAVIIVYQKGKKYSRVPEAAVKKIVAARAGAVCQSGAAK